MNGIAKHVSKVIMAMTLRRDLYKEILEGMEKPHCYGYLTYPQMYEANECYCCEWLEQCGKESKLHE